MRLQRPPHTRAEPLDGGLERRARAGGVESHEVVGGAGRVEFAARREDEQVGPAVDGPTAGLAGREADAVRCARKRGSSMRRTSAAQSDADAAQRVRVRRSDAADGDAPFWLTVT